MIDPRLLALARNQSGITTRAQLTTFGMSSGAVSRAVASGWFTRLLPGVYLVAPAGDSFIARCRAVDLWLGDAGLLTARTAGRLLGLARMGTGPIQCIVPERRNLAAPDWVEVHRSRWFGHDRTRATTKEGIVVTSGERTLFAIAALTSTQRRFDHIADDAWNLQLISPGSMSDFLTRHRCRGKDGVRKVERWLERWLEAAVPDARPTQSYFERDLIDALRAVGLPEPATQHELVLSSDERIHLDIAWPNVRLGIEPGHTRFHDPTRDALRDLACAELGWMIHRLDEYARPELGRFARLIAASYRRRRADLLGH